MLSEMSVNDLATVGHALGFGETIDNYRFVVWNANATDKNGYGFTNNRVFAQNPSYTFSSPNMFLLQVAIKLLYNQVKIMELLMMLSHPNYHDMLR